VDGVIRGIRSDLNCNGPLSSYKIEQLY
jgi:hypothetical protein